MNLQGDFLKSTFQKRSVLECCLALFLIATYPTFLRAEAELPHIAATTSMIGDLLKEIGGETFELDVLMGAGVDPHLYRATQGDLKKLTRARAIFYNGLHLEGKMTQVLEKLSRRKPSIAVAEAIPKDFLRLTDGSSGQPDPHVWFDVSLWEMVAEQVENSLVELFPHQSSVYRKNGASYKQKLQILHSQVREEIQKIPVRQRILVTAHDAFGYFGDAYDIEVIGLQGISTATEFGLYDLKRITDLVIKRKVKAVFVESSVPARFVEALQKGVLARGHRLELGGTLYSDAMGEAGTPEGTYTGMVKHNVATIVRALK
jgi:manganese/zinc/iron transport system substrate-binding protein